jgi:murein DD-endopeptidase MepM/ murein hydrolase activator NlpD
MNAVYVTVGQTVNLGTPLGTIGATGGVLGTGNVAHAHVALYKDITESDLLYPGASSAGISRLSAGLSVGVCTRSDPNVDWYCPDPNNYPINRFSAPFKFDAVSGGEGGGDETSIANGLALNSGFYVHASSSRRSITVQVLSPSLEEVQVRLFDVMGGVHYFKNLNPRLQKRIDIHGLNPGVYLLQVIGRDGLSVGKILVQ